MTNYPVENKAYQLISEKRTNWDIWSVKNYSVYFESNRDEQRPNTKFYSLANYLFFYQKYSFKDWTNSDSFLMNFSALNEQLTTSDKHYSLKIQTKFSDYTLKIKSGK